MDNSLLGLLLVYICGWPCVQWKWLHLCGRSSRYLLICFCKPILIMTFTWNYSHTCLASSVASIQPKVYKVGEKRPWLIMLYILKPAIHCQKHIFHQYWHRIVWNRLIQIRQTYQMDWYTSTYMKDVPVGYS